MLAVQREPSQLTPDPEGAYPLSFPRLVQPVLDRNCVPCHQTDKTGKAPDLTAKPVSLGTRKHRRTGKRLPGTQWTRSYMSLQKFAYGCSGKPRDRQPTRTTPGKFGAQASKLYRKLKEGHHDLKLSDEDMYRITTWLDCNSNFLGAYHDVAKQARGERVMPLLE